MIIALPLAALLAAAPAVVPNPPGPYSWVCSYLDAAPTLFGVMGLPGEAQNRGVAADPARIAAEVDANCPRYSGLVDSSLGLVVGG